ncbi:MAG TPA: cytidine deaminase [Candidatus Hydrogenedentes bacterium]|nr:cytidine deaminase [Candidatus Hydrogenedentota bacterium]HIJ73347.1 cytidine deaminase [Candidatus Hydrogenedentota bacterium]
MASHPERPPWDTYFMRMAFLAAERSTCLRRHVGAVAVRDKRILATGYNDVPSGVRHCHELGGCLRERKGVESGELLDYCRTVHAEQNVIIQCAIHAVSLRDAVVYCTHQPCLTCSKMLVNAKIKGVYYYHPYPSVMAEELFEEAGVFLKPLSPAEIEHVK